jgi:nucleotide-binding universal stress UspA family protein
VDVLTVLEPTTREPASGGVLGAPDSAGRDAADAANVATARLAGRATVETLTREGRPVDTISSVAAERDVDVILLGNHGGHPGADAGIGSVTQSVLETCDRPVVVLPLDSLDH